MRSSQFKLLRHEMQDNFSGVHVNDSEHFRADEAEPIMNDIVKVVGSIRDNGHFSFGQVEAKELAADRDNRSWCGKPSWRIV